MHESVVHEIRPGDGEKAQAYPVFWHVQIRVHVCRFAKLWYHQLSKHSRLLWLSLNHKCMDCDCDVPYNYVTNFTWLSQCQHRVAHAIE